MRQRGQERHIEVARSEAERRAVILAQDADDIVRAELLARAQHALGAVVVSGDRQRPGAEQPVVVVQQLRRRLGGAERIEALVDRVVDAHEAPAGRAHELPQARRADLGVSRRIERRLDVRQCRDLRRQTKIGQHLGDVRLPGARAHEPGTEAVRLAELEAHVVGRLGKSRRHCFRRPEIMHFLLVGIGWRRTRPEAPQHLDDAVTLCLDARLALVHRRIGIEVHASRR